MVTLGYIQIPGIYYTESFSLVAIKNILPTGIAITHYFYGENWICELVDVESAFLEGKLNIKVYINLSKVMVEFGFMSQE